MTIVLNPKIPNLDPESLVCAIYKKLYQSFFDAQDKHSSENPTGIIEGDQVSIRLHNTAYNFADTIDGAVGAGSGGAGEADLKFIHKTGDSMSGALSANYGFTAGIGNSEVLTISTKLLEGVSENIVSVLGKIDISKDGFLVDGYNVMKYYTSTNTTTLNGQYVDIPASKVTIKNLVVGGESEGLIVSPSVFKYKNKDVYHAGNCNSPSIDWVSKNFSAHGDFVAKGSSLFDGDFTTLSKVSFQNAGLEALSIKDGRVNVAGWLHLSKGIQSNNSAILSIESGNVLLGSGGGNLTLGSATTSKIVLNSSLWDYNESHLIINKYGSASFHNGVSIKHNFGDIIFQSFRNDELDEGVLFPKKIKLDNVNGISISGASNTLSFLLPLDSAKYAFLTQSIKSTSFYAPQNRPSATINLNTDSDFFLFSKPVEVNDFVGISKSSTRLLNNSLFFKNNSYLLSVSDGIKYYGNSYFTGNISSESFASGFSGYGAAIIKNQTNGLYDITTDTLVVRSKMRVYELEVQKTNATNGSLWVTNSCSGDIVSKII